MTGTGDNQQGWGPPRPGGPPPGYPQPYYPPGYPPPQQPYPPQYPPAPAPYYPPRQAPPPYPPPQYPPQQQYPQQQQPYAQPVVIPIEGTGTAKLAARLNKRSVIVSPDGFAYESKKNNFRLGWRELRRIAITTAFHQDRTRIAVKVWRVRVIMDAADPGFAQRHPEIGGLMGKFGASGPGSYGLPLGPVENVVGPLAQALAYYAGPLFGGVIEEGQVLGMGYL